MIFSSISAQNIFFSTFCAYVASVYKHHIHVVNQIPISSTNDKEKILKYQTMSKKISFDAI